MKKYLLTFLIALIIGLFLLNFSLKQYNDYSGIKVSSKYDEVYFIQYGVFSSVESMEENTISLQNYVYTMEDNLYYVYIGITTLEENALKLQKYFESKGYKTILKKFGISNQEFIKLLDNYDEVLKKTDDETAISSVNNQVLSKYEEVVINGSKN